MFNVAGDESVTNVRLAQLDRAFGYGPKGREFESSNAHEALKMRVFRAFLFTKFCKKLYLKTTIPVIRMQKLQQRF